MGEYMEKYRVSYIDLSTGETIAYRKTGKGSRTFVLVHGNMSSSVYFEDMMDELGKENTVYALDLPGFGDSTYNRIQESLFDISLDLSEFIVKLDLKNVYLLGWSTGGGICLETAADLPDRITKIFIVSSVGIKGYPVYKKTIFTPLSTELIRTREEMIEYNIMVRPMLSMYKRKNKYLMRGVLENSIYTKKIPNEEDLEKYVEGSLKQRNYVDILTALVNFNMTSKKVNNVRGSGRAEFIKAPIYIIHGDNDIVVDLSFAKASADYFGSRAQLKIFRGSGHSIMTDDFEGLINYIKAHY